MKKQNIIHDVYTRLREMYSGKFILTYLGKPLDESLKASVFHNTTLVLVNVDSISSVQRRVRLAQSTKKIKTAQSRIRKLSQSWLTRYRNEKNSLASTRAHATQYEAMLKHVCKVSGHCLALGRYTPEINAFFQYETFKYNILPTHLLGTGSSAVAYKIDYERNGYTSSAILKHGSEGDNLTYEYLVGTQFVNRVNLYFPCFISTYGLYYGQYTDLKTLELQRKVNYNKSCLQHRATSVLVQHVQGKELYSMILDKSIPEHDLIAILYIIYHALANLSTQFTHYDLSTSNVLLLKLPVPIEYDYGNVRVRSHYLPKIIDYGRCFFDNGSLNSRKIYHDVCASKKCRQCGDYQGFSLLNPTPWHFISSTKNESHDLKLLFMLYQTPQKLKTSWGTLDPLLQNVVYGVGEPSDTQHYGTPENLTSTGKIHNVHDALQGLEDVIPPSVYPHISGRLLIRPGVPMVFETI